MTQDGKGLLSGMRIIEVSMLGPAAITTALADLGADVVKVEPPQGDYVRRMTWPIVEGVSLMHLHVNRGKRSITIDLKTEEGVALLLDLVREADVIVEAMRPGGLARRGLTFERMAEVNPRLVQCTISGYGMTGPYETLASHGIAYDAWAGIFDPEIDENGFPSIPNHVSIGINAAPLFGGIAILAAVIRARETGSGTMMELAQSDAAAAFDWYRSETFRAYERPETEVTGNASDNYERRAPAIAGMRGGVRYQVYASADGFVLFMASEQHFWKKFCAALDRSEMFDKWPGSEYGDHARGNNEMRTELTAIFSSRTTSEWVEFGVEVDVPLAPVNTPQTLPQDPQFRSRIEWIPSDQLGAEQLPFPVFISGDDERPITKAPEVGEHSDEVLRDVLGLDAAAIAQMRDSGALG
ncbi:putative acyl-CoA transferase/carnitine dehydratase [Actinobacteria bacterium IMCC26256]|nr:putative acyl-CoA transferase/carnitine dehydratase [Actinobacteria bacterium IMCC26256]